MPEDEPYLWDYLVYHLSEAGLTGELYATITDLRYLVAKSHARSAAAAEADLRAAQKHFPDDPLLRTLSRHFTNATHLGKGETVQDVQLILYSRLHSLEALQSQGEALLAGLKSPYLLPAHPLPDLPHPALIRTLTGHTNTVLGCAYSPDGRFIVSASEDTTLKVWDVSTLLHTGAQTGHEQMTGHTEAVFGCAYSPDGRFILSASYDKTLKVWDAQTGRCLVTLAVEWPLIDCAWSPDGTGVVAVGNGGVYFFKVVV